jgi:hypothetical protein
MNHNFLKQQNSKNSIVNTDSGSILASLFRKIMYELGITPSKFSIMLERYIVNAGLPGTDNSRDAATMRGNIKKELLKTTMTWNNFIKGLKFLNAIRLELKITIHYNEDKKTSHTIAFNLDNAVDYEIIDNRDINNE